MPDKWPLANGVWSNASNWNGGTKPVAGDIVYADGKTVDIDENVTVQTITNAQRSGGTIGGTFTSSSNVTIAANITCSTSGTVLTYTGGSNTLTINGNLSYPNSFNSTVNLFVVTSGIVVINGNATGSPGGNPAGACILISGSGCSVTLNGTPLAGTGGTTATAVTMSGNSTLLITGNPQARVGHAISISSGTVTIIGDTTGGTSASTYGLNATGGGNISITGNVTGGNTAVASPVGVFVSGNNNVTVTGNVSGGTGGTSAGGADGIRHSGAGVVDIVGTITATSTSSGVVVSNYSGILRHSGNLVDDASGRCSAYAQIYQINALAQMIYTRYTIGNIARFLYTANAATLGYPLASNVRNGTVYGQANQFTGTLAVPSAANVRNGVAVDNTVGTANLTAQDFWDALTSGITTNGSIGKLIKDNLDAAITSRLASAGYTAPDNAGITAIKAKTDNLPANPASQTNLDVAVSTRLATAGYTAPANADVAAIKAKTDNLPASPANESTVAAVKAKTDNLPADPASNTQVNTRLAAADYTTPPTAAAVRAEIDANSTKLDATVSSRLAGAGYTAPDNSSISAIKAKTDNLPTDPADQSQLEAAISNAVAAIISQLPPETDNAAVSAAVWSAVTRTLTSYPEGTTAQQVWEYASRSLTEAPDVPTAEEISARVWDDQPQRLANVATVQTTGEQIAALNP